MSSTAISGTTITTGEKPSKFRYVVLLLIAVVTVINYADRSILSITGTSITHDFNLSAKDLGVVFSAFGWAYAIGQIPGGWLLDKFGSKKVYGYSLFLWSLFTVFQGFITPDSYISSVIVSFFFCRFMLGLVESPAFPANSRIVANWFPTKERGFASSVFNSSQYFATVLFTPFMAYIVSHSSWHNVFFVMGGLGIVLSIVWMLFELNPNKQKRMNAAELAYIKEGGALVDLDKPADSNQTVPVKKFSNAYILKRLLTSRMLLGIYIGQYCITALSYFFTTWFPIYLIKGRGMSILDAGIAAVVPAICGFAGGILGGIISDILLRRGYSNTFARKAPFAIGMFLATALAFCNFITSQWVVIAVMALAFFGKGLGAIGWAVVSDVAPKEALGLTGGVFNGLGNIAGIFTPLVIGYIVDATGSFEGALYFVGAHSLLASISYLLIVGKLKRIEL